MPYLILEPKPDPELLADMFVCIMFSNVLVRSFKGSVCRQLVFIYRILSVNDE